MSLLLTGVGAGTAGGAAPFDPSALPGGLAFYRIDQGATTFPASTFLIASTQYLSTPGAWLNGLTKLSLSGFAYLAGFKDGVQQCVVSQDAASQHCFRVIRTAANKLRVYVAASLADTGSNYLESAVTVAGGTGGQTVYHLGIVYDGTLSAAYRLKLYVNGTLDSSATITGAIPTSLTASTAPLAFGWDGATSYFEGQMWSWGAWAGMALTAGNMTTLAAWNQSGNPTYYGYAGLQVGGVTHFWEMGA